MHMNFNASSDEKNCIFTYNAEGKKIDASKERKSGPACIWTKLPSKNVSVFCYYNQCNQTSKVLLLTPLRGPWANMNLLKTSCYEQILHYARELSHSSGVCWLFCTDQAHPDSRDLQCQLQLPQGKKASIHTALKYLFLHKKPAKHIFSTNCRFSILSLTCFVPLSYSLLFWVSFLPSVLPHLPLPLPQLICCILFHAVTLLVEPNLLAEVDY